MNHAAPATDAALLPLADVTAEGLMHCGGKARGLRAATAVGLPVPAAALWRDGCDDPAAVAAELRRVLGPPPYFVRSSFGDEDAVGRTFAGQGLSKGHLWPDEVPAAVAAVRASWQSPPAVAYRRRMGMGDTAGGAVLVQREILPLWSGVLFTRAPGAVGNWARIEAVRGYGEAVVSGRAAPSVVEFAHAADRTLADGGDVPSAVHRQLRRMLDRLEAVAGGPADVEWVLDPRGKVWIVQVRPASVAEAPVWSSALGAEFWSGDVSRLMFETVGRVIDDVMIAEPLSVLGEGRGPHLRRADGRIWVGIAGLRRALAVVPSWAVTDTVLRMLPPALRARWQAERRAHSPLVPPALIAAAPRFLRAGFPWPPLVQFVALPRLRRRADAWRDRPLPADRPALTAEIDALLADLGSNLRWVTWGMLYAYVLTPLLDRLLGDLQERTSAGCLYAGLPFDPVRELDDDLRRLVRRYSSLAAGRVREDPAAAAALDRLNARWGHRAEERDLRGRRWAEAPELPEALLPLAAAAEPPRGSHWLRWLAGRAAENPLRLPRLALIALLAAVVRPYLGFRERMRDLADRYLLALRRRLLALAAIDGIADPWSCGYADGRFVEGADPDHLRFGDRKPLFLLGDAALDDDSGDTAGGLRGLAVSVGVAEGRAVWIDRPEDMHRFRPGDVLCAEYLDPSLSLALEHAAAAVFVHGGALSHGAIVAREYGVPAVVAVVGLRRAVDEGNLVRVDGVGGTVTVLG